MRIATLAMMALPLVLAHTSPMDRKSHERHSEMERRQLFGPAEEDEPAVSDPHPISSSSTFEGNLYQLKISYPI